MDLSYFRARYYHAELGRFISRDPIGYVDGLNLYRAYFAPKSVDPFGLRHKDETIYWNPAGGFCWKQGISPAGPISIIVDCPTCPGGFAAPGTEGTHCNCLGDSIGINKALNWPGFVPKNCNIKKILAFVPKGCKEVSCHEKCDCEHNSLELMFFLWFANFPDGKGGENRWCGFHVLGRNCGDTIWHTKAGDGPCYYGITEPGTHLGQVYPDLEDEKLENTVARKCFHCESNPTVTDGKLDGDFKW